MKAGTRPPICTVRAPGDTTRLALPRALLTRGEYYGVTAGDRLFATAADGDTVPGVVLVIGGEPVLELASPLGPEASWVDVRRAPGIRTVAA